MKNIFDVWRQFNTNQLNLKGPESVNWMKEVSRCTEEWSEESFPRGEYWKYISYGDLETTKLKQAVAKESANNVWLEDDQWIVYINDFSQINDIKSPSLFKGVSLRSHKDILESDHLKDKLLKLFSNSKKDENSLAKVPLSFLGLGLVLVVDNSVVVDKPIKFIFDLNHLQEKDNFAPFSIQVLMGEQSSANIFIETKAQELVGFYNIRIDMNLEAKAQLNLSLKEQGGSQSRTMIHNYIGLASEAKLNFIDLTLPGKWSRHNTVVSLNDPLAEARVNGVYLNNNDYFCDHHTEIKHMKERTTSFQDYKGILSGKAKAVFNGKVFIEKMAKKSSSEQINKNLMLSKKAEVNTKPELQIYNDDVKAAHGATIGKIDNEQLFYLQSRGFTKEQSWRALARAFVFEVLEDEPLQTKDFFVKDISSSLEYFEEL